MSRKHNTDHAHQSHGKYWERLAKRGIIMVRGKDGRVQGSAQIRMSDPRLSDGKPASAKR